MNEIYGGLRNRVRRLIGPLSGLPPEDREAIEAIKDRRLTYLSDRRLRSIVTTCRSITSQGLSGCFVEAGCALGGSTILISKHKGSQRPLYVYDVFDMIPPPTEEDGDDIQERYERIRSGQSEGLGGDTYYGYQDDLYAKVQANLREFDLDPRTDRIHLIKGLLQDTLRIDEPVAFAHIDVDWYDPVRACLERIVPRLVVGGVVILDDYKDWSGCHRAADEYFQGRSGFRMDDSSGSLKIQRVA